MDLGPNLIRKLTKNGMRGVITFLHFLTCLLVNFLSFVLSFFFVLSFLLPFIFAVSRIRLGFDGTPSSRQQSRKENGGGRSNGKHLAQRAAGYEWMYPSGHYCKRAHIYTHTKCLAGGRYSWTIPWATPPIRCGTLEKLPAKG